MSDDAVLVSRPLEHIALVTINRPEAANAINAAVTQRMVEIVAQIENDAETRAVILTGAGDRVFCAGADLKAISAGGREGLYTEENGFAGFNEAPRTKLWIAAVEGAALAGGLEIALACDIIVAGEKARFGLPEVMRGLVAAAGGLYRLPRRVGLGTALEFAATGQPVDATRAKAIGLVDHLEPSGLAVAKAIEIATAVAANAPIAVAESLGIVRRVFDHPATELRQLSVEASLRNAETEDFREGPLAFIEKRPPVWKGR